MGFQFVLRDQRRNMSTVTEKSSKAGKKPAKSTAAKKVDAAHPPSSVMVQKAIEGLGEKKGSSLASIKKYIGANYKVDLVKMNIFIRKALKSGIERKAYRLVAECLDALNSTKWKANLKLRRRQHRRKVPRNQRRKPHPRRQKRLKLPKRRPKNQWPRKQRKNQLPKSLLQRKSS